MIKRPSAFRDDLETDKQRQERLDDVGDHWGYTLLAGADGRMALAEGWGRELYLWGKAHPGHMPTQADLGACVEATQKFRRQFKAAIEEAKKVSPKTQFGGIALAVALRAGAAMENREAQLRQKHGVAIDPERALA